MFSNVVSKVQMFFCHAWRRRERWRRHRPGKHRRYRTPNANLIGSTDVFMLDDAMYHFSAYFRKESYDANVIELPHENELRMMQMADLLTSFKVQAASKSMSKEKCL